MRLTVALLVAALLALAIPSGATPITGCTTITAPGYYTLENDITDSPTCIQITSSDVVFDGGGHTIDGVDASNTYGVYVHNSTTTLTNVTVKNLIVTDWDYGIYYKNAQNGSVENNTATSNTHPIDLLLSNYNAIANNTASSNTYGIILSASSNNLIINNNAKSSNSFSGIILSGAYGSGSDNNILINNNASNNARHGIDLSGNNNTLTNNTASNNANHGISL